MSVLQESAFANGIDLCKWIVENKKDAWPVEIVLRDGDKISINIGHAVGITKIHSSLKQENREKMSQMDILHLLSIYCEAVKDGILREESLKLYPQCTNSNPAKRKS